MKNVARVLVSIVALAVYPVVAHAQLTLVTQSGSSTTTYVGFNSSYTFQAAPGTANGWTAEGPTAASALTYTSTAAEYWAAPIGTSTWVSFEPNTQPGGVNDGNTNTDIGAYEYMSNAFATTAGSTSCLIDATLDSNCTEPTGLFTAPGVSGVFSIASTECIR